MMTQKSIKRELPIYIGFSLLLGIVLIFSVLIAVSIGSTSIPVRSVYSVILYKLFHIDAFSAFSQGAIHDVVWLIRLPRIILAISVGGGLSVCGIVMQAIVRNPLADPYILGVSSGASLGATIAILLGVGVVFGTGYVGIVAFMGAFIAAIFVMAIANIGSRATSVKLLLSGLAINAVFSSFSSFIVFFANDKDGIQDITFWLMGSLAGAKWSVMPIIYLVTVGGSLFFLTQYRNLNLMLLGDETSITLGTDLHKARHFYMLVVALMIGFVVFSAGMIGFIGLIIPHFMRMLFGTDHKKIIPVSFLAGGVFMVWADVFSRILIPHTELPIGILVSMIGAPCFIYLLVRKSYGFGGKES
ncbi:iron ABC transporter permease [Fusibacter bizertensis]